MITYIVRRILLAIPMLLGISVLLFGLLHLAPGSFTDTMLGPGRMVDREMLEQYERKLGLDQPVPVQYVRWLGAALSGDLGVSFNYNRPVADLIAERLPATLELMGVAMALAAVLALFVGIAGAVSKHSWIDHLGTGFVFFGLSMPVFWFGLILQIVFGVWLRWLPVSGTGSELQAGFFEHARYLVLPATVLSLRYVARWSRYLRDGLLRELPQAYIRTAWAKGLRARTVIGVHALKNASLAVVAQLAMDLALVFSGAVITETVFSWPGIGRLFVQGMSQRDYPLLMGILMMGSLMVIVFNLLADIVHALLDPRIRPERLEAA